TARAKFAMVCAWPQAPSEGAVIGYGPDYSDIYRLAGSYISRIMKGESPSELPGAESSQILSRRQLEGSQEFRCNNFDQSARSCNRGDRITMEFAAMHLGPLMADIVVKVQNCVVIFFPPKDDPTDERRSL